MTNIAARVRRYAERQQLWAPGARVAVAVSGGADSVALLGIMRELAGASHLVVAGVAHLNHQLRADADRDEAFCEDLSRRAVVPFDAGRVDVRGLARAQRCSLEAAARRARYEFLEGARQRLDASVVAVAHTRDDQAESVLLRLMRGTGTTGLRGVLPVRGAFVRPVLDVSRAELRAYLAARGDQWVEDASNSDLANPRNRIRHELLPLLAERYQPGVVKLLARTADVARHDDRYLEAAARRAARRAIDPSPTGCRIAPSNLLALPEALRRRVVRRALEAAGSRSARLVDIECVLDACRDPARAPTVVAGLRMERFSPDVVLLSRAGDPGVAGLPDRVLEVPGLVELPELGEGWRLQALGPIQDRTGSQASAHCATLDRRAFQGPLVVRSRRPGDRMRPLGVGGSKKLQDLFVDRKVPRSERDRIPVVADAAGRIVWVVGVALAEDVAATERSDDVVILNFERLAPAGPEAS